MSLQNSKIFDMFHNNLYNKNNKKALTKIKNCDIIILSLTNGVLR
jgi:hypothetical protein